jgi:hypothetical protein
MEWNVTSARGVAGSGWAWHGLPSELYSTWYVVQQLDCGGRCNVLALLRVAGGPAERVVVPARPHEKPFSGASCLHVVVPRSSPSYWVPEPIVDLEPLPARWSWAVESLPRTSPLPSPHDRRAIVRSASKPHAPTRALLSVEELGARDVMSSLSSSRLPRMTVIQDSYGPGIPDPSPTTSVEYHSVKTTDILPFRATRPARTPLISGLSKPCVRHYALPAWCLARLSSHTSSSGKCRLPNPIPRRDLQPSDYNTSFAYSAVDTVPRPSATATARAKYDISSLLFVSRSPT